MSMYVGLCIGGIADGEWIKSESPVFRRAIFPSVPPVNERFEENQEKNISVNADEYRAEAIYTDSQTRYLFVLNGLRVIDAIDEMMKRYVSGR